MTGTTSGITLATHWIDRTSYEIARGRPSISSDSWGITGVRGSGRSAQRSAFSRQRRQKICRPGLQAGLTPAVIFQPAKRAAEQVYVGSLNLLCRPLRGLESWDAPLPGLKAGPTDLVLPLAATVRMDQATRVGTRPSEPFDTVVLELYSGALC
jgi:hypothetical protein